MNQTSLRLRVVPRYPARIAATDGLKAVRDGVDLTIRSDYSNLVQVPTVSNPDRTFMLAWDSDIDNYQSVSFTNIINNIQDAIIGPPLAAIDAANPGADQVVYFTDVGEASTFTASDFVRGIANAPDQESYLSVIGAATVDQGAKAETALQPSFGQVSYATIAALAGAEVPASVRSVYVQGYYVAGDKGTALYQWVSSEPTTPGKIQSADGAWWQIAEAVLTPYMFGAKGNNSNDDFQAFRDLGDFCGLTKRAGFIARGQYVLSQQLVWTIAFNVTSDHTAIMRWINSASCGIQLDLRQFWADPFTMDFPALLSPAINSSFAIPGYSAAEGWAYDVNSRVGDAVNIRASSRYSIYIHNAQGWTSAFHPEATYDVTYGARVAANIELCANTIDFCERAFWLDGGPANSGGLAAFNCYTNTAWVKYVVYADADGGFVGAGGSVEIGGQVFLNEVGGCAVYGLGNNTSGMSFRAVFISAGKGSDSPAGTPAGLVCQYLGGASASNGQTTDGNVTTGYFAGFRNQFEFGCVMGFPLSLSPKIGGFPMAGDAIRVKDAGAYNTVTILQQDQSPGGAISMSTTQGEANFNGGVGSAQLARKILVSAAVPTLTAGQAARFYFYSQLLSAGSKRPMLVSPLDTTLGDSGLTFVAGDRVSADSVNRQGSVFVSNKTGGTVTGATYFFWIVIENQ